MDSSVGDKENINKKLPNWEDVEILRRLRNRFGHSFGKYNPKDEEDKKLMDALMHRYEPSQDIPKDFPINQDKVIYPIAQGVLQYAKFKLSQK